MRRPSLLAIVVAAAGAVGWALGFAASPERALVGWLFAFVFGLSIALGALLLVLVTDAAGATWFVVLRPAATAMAATLPVFAALIVPILASMTILYPWASPPASLDEHALEQVHGMQRWLRPGPFVVRALLYLGVWSALAVAVRRVTSRGARRVVGGLGSLLVAFTASWAAFEWIMSLHIGWGSTVFGVLFCVTCFLAGTCAVAIAGWAERRGHVLPPEVKPDHFHALGRLVLVGVALWAYLQFSQLWLIWSAHVPKEVTFYEQRTHGAWSAASWVLVIGHFVVPFLALLMRSLKRRPALLAATSAWILLVHLVDMAWLVLPSRAGAPALVDLAALAVVAGAASAVGLRVFAAADAIPHHDPALGAALRYESP